MKAEFHLERVSKKQNNFLPEHGLRHYCYISSRFEILLSISKFLQSISTAQQSLSNVHTVFQ